MAEIRIIKRNVRFVPDQLLCEYHGGAVLEITDACRRDIWFQYNDLLQFKRKAVAVSKEAQRYGVGSLLTNTYGSTNSADVQEVLTAWCRNANSRRGLERWINAEYSAKRADIRRRTIQSVLRAQQKIRKDNITDVHYGMKVLSRLSEAFSQDSRVFARALGIADERAVQTDAAEAASVSTTTTTSKMAANNEIAAGALQSLSPRTVITRPSRTSLGVTSATDLRHFY
jgi:hypothetical protein